MAAKKAMPWCAHKSAIFGRSLWCYWYQGSEVQNDVYVCLCAVSPFAKHMGFDPIHFPAQGEVRVEAIVDPPADMKGEAILAMPRGLRQDVHAATDNVRPRLQLAGAPCNFWSGAIAEEFHVVVAVDGGREGCIDGALDGKPVVCEIGDRSIGAYARRVE